MSENIVSAAGSNISAALAIVAILFFLFGVIIGEHVGERVGDKCLSLRHYLLANVAWLVGGALVSALIVATGWLMFAAFAVGIMAGGLAGTKIAYGESVGPWKFLDKTLHANKAHVKAAEDAAAHERNVARKQARKAGQKEPEYISAQADPGASRTYRQPGKKGNKH